MGRLARSTSNATRVTMKTPLLRRALLLWGALLVLGCSNDPDAGWAQEQYKAHKPMIDEVAGEVTKAFDVYAPVPFEDMDKANLEQVKAAQQKREEAFDATVLAALTKHKDKIIGWEIYYSFPPPVEEGKKPKPVIKYYLKKSSEHVPSWKPGTIRTDRRDVKVDETRELAWGLYQVPGKETKETLGMKALQYHSGFEVKIPAKKGKAQLDLFLFIVPPEKE